MSRDQYGVFHMWVSLLTVTHPGLHWQCGNVPSPSLSFQLEQQQGRHPGLAGLRQMLWVGEYIIVADMKFLQIMTSTRNADYNWTSFIPMTGRCS